MVVYATFKDMDYRIVEAANGREAVDLALAEPPDLVLMDLMMPEMDGLEATRILKQDERTNRIPILMLTALSETEDRISAFDAGATGFLTKPFDRLELMAHVRSYLNLSLINRKYILSTANRHTGLPNRAAFRDRIGEYRHPLLFLIKLDNIETIGRFYGDATVVALERYFAEALPSMPIRCPVPPGENGEMGRQAVGAEHIFHFGSGLFGVIYDLAWTGARAPDRDRALQAAEELYRDLLRFQGDWEELQYESDFTIAVSVNREDLLEEAELAVTEASKKQLDIVFAGDVVDEAYETIENNMLWLRKIRNALSREAFVPHYQPIFNNRTKRIEKYEALVRMINEDGSVVSPGHFLVVAKNSKYYPRITQRVVQQAVETFRDRPEDIAINLSVLDTENVETRNFIFQTLEENPDVASRTTIEIVEEEGLVHYDVVKAFIERVKRYGVRIAIDDFGSGYSNFARIVDLDVDYIKIDGSLIRSIGQDPAIRNLVEGITSFAGFSDMEVIAEFVEDAGILELVDGIGVEYAQGYCIGKPQAGPRPAAEAGRVTGCS